MRNVTNFLLILLFVLIGSAGAVERTLEISDREIVERLTRLEEGQKYLRDDIKANRKEIQNVRDELNGNIQSFRDELKSFMLWGFGITFAGIFALIGFVLWDRRTAIAPVVRENRELTEREKRIENVLKEYARKEPRLLEILKSFGIL